MRVIVLRILVYVCAYYIMFMQKCHYMCVENFRNRSTEKKNTRLLPWKRRDMNTKKYG